MITAKRIKLLYSEIPYVVWKYTKRFGFVPQKYSPNTGQYCLFDRKLKKWDLINQRGGTCEGCGRDFIIMDMAEFHHVDRTKEDSYATNVYSDKAYEDPNVMKDFNSNIVVLCNECHVMAHNDMLRVYRHNEERTVVYKTKKYWHSVKQQEIRMLKYTTEKLNEFRDKKYEESGKHDTKNNR